MHGARRQFPSIGFVMMICGTAAAPLMAQRADTLPPPCAGPCVTRIQAGLPAYRSAAAPDTGRRRAIEYSNTYVTFMKIHRIGSYFELPLFVAEYVVGEKLLSDERSNPDGRSSLKGPHSAIAGGLGVLFTVNTFTGVWALVESRHEPAGRARRWIHTIAMLVADGGFVATAAAARSAKEDPSAADNHRALAIGSMSLAAAASIMMWLWKD